MSCYSNIVHPFPPVFDNNSRLLVLGSFPSPDSRKNGFYYGHKQNRFWTVLSAVFSESAGENAEEKRTFLLKHGVALWDVLASCTIKGAEDSSICNVCVNDLTPLLKTGIKRIYTSGRKAEELYMLYQFRTTGIKALYLPSTSPANRGKWPDEKLINAYKVLAE